MTEKVEVEKIDEVYMKVVADPGTLQEISEFFSFHPPNYQFSPKFKARVWDGYIRLVTPFKPFLYIGLLSMLKQFCEVRDYTLILNDGLGDKEKFADTYATELATELKTPFMPRDYQCEYISNALRTGRSLSLSPTSSGKSFIQYLIAQHYYKTYRHRTLIVVPTTSLVHQMASDFGEYGCNEDMIHTIYEGKESDKPFFITTWQSIQRFPAEWFDQFRVVMGDEAHLFAAKSLVGIMEKCVNVPYRFGFTGTISSDSKTHKLVLQGLFGELVRYVTTKELIDEGSVAKFKIKCIVLNYPDDVKKKFRSEINKMNKETGVMAKSKRYPAEREFIVNNTKRNLFIRNLVWSLKDQNNLIIFELVEKHGKILEPLLRKEGRELHFIHGGVSGEERERIRHLVENDPEKKHNILASSGSFATGTSLKRRDNLIVVNAGKSEIRNLQAIGRTLRKGNGADDATLYDIADDLSIGSFKNYTLDHFRKRVEVYSAEQFPFKVYNIPLT
jgi:superfamily II DNA or RNA helicase